jgi:hypothetical protein
VTTTHTASSKPLSVAETKPGLLERRALKFLIKIKELIQEELRMSRGYCAFEPKSMQGEFEMNTAAERRRLASLLIEVAAPHRRLGGLGNRLTKTAL